MYDELERGIATPLFHWSCMDCNGVATGSRASVALLISL